MHGGGERHEDVPDGVGEGDHAVALEEEHAQAVDEAAARQFVEALGVAHRRDHRGGKEAHGQVEGQLHQFVLFVVVEDVDGSGGGHEPHEPAHVSSQRTQLTEVQPGRVGGSDEEIDDNSVAHVEAVLYGPHVALLPGDDVEHGGHQEQGAQPEAVHPGRDLLPAVVGQSVQQRHAHEGRHDEESVSVAVCSVLVAGGLVAAVCRGSSVHEPLEAVHSLHFTGFSPNTAKEKQLYSKIKL